MSDQESSDTPVFDLLARMTADSLEVSSLDPQTLALVRLAALVAVGAPPASYLANLSLAADLDVDSEQVRGVLAAVAPIVGTVRVVAAGGNIVAGELALQDRDENCRAGDAAEKLRNEIAGDVLALHASGRPRRGLPTSPSSRQS